MDHTTIQLVSNASMRLHPENSLSSFINFLPEQIALDGEWEVALSEIIFPSTIHNVVDGTFQIIMPTKYTGEGSYEELMKPCSIPKRYYRNVGEIIDTMNGVMVDQVWRQSLANSGYSTTLYELGSIGYKVDGSGFMSIVLPELKDSPTSPIFLSLGKSLANIFGFTENQRIDKENIGKYPVDIVGGRHCMYVYTDIVEYSILGDVKAPILRTIPLISKIRKHEACLAQTLNYKSFDHLLFKRVLMQSFHSIRVRLLDSLGNQIPFSDIGRTVLTLLFRKV